MRSAVLSDGIYVFHWLLGVLTHHCFQFAGLAIEAGNVNRWRLVYCLQERITELEICIDKLRSEMKKIKSQEASSAAELDDVHDELGWSDQMTSVDAVDLE